MIEFLIGYAAGMLTVLVLLRVYEYLDAHHG